MPRRTAAALLLLLMVPQLTGCSTQWHPVTTPAAQMDGAKPGVIFRLRTREDSVLILRAVRVVGDSVTGVIWNPGVRPRPDSVRVVALRDIQAAERMGSGDGAAGGVLLLLIVAGVALAAADPCLAAFC